MLIYKTKKQQKNSFGNKFRYADRAFVHSQLKSPSDNFPTLKNNIF